MNSFNPDYAIELRYENRKCNKTRTFKTKA